MENKNNKINRKTFLMDTSKGAAGMIISASALGSFLQSCSHSKALVSSSAYTTGFTQMPLPYAYNALEPVIDARTMEIHYTKHAAGYATKLNEAIKKEMPSQPAHVEVILQSISKYSDAMRNNAGGHFNHELFWKTMQPMVADNNPYGSLKSAIDKDFGSLDALKTQFNEAAMNRFGSGWAWLYINSNKKLAIGSTPNQDNPLMNISAIQGFPLMGIDVWEHAYYLKYQNKRKDYVANWWKLINWAEVQKRFEMVKP